MVKNAKGGNKSKGFARKFISSSSPTSLRVPMDPLEQFAIVYKMYGTMCDVMLHDQSILKCQIRGKFRGRSKRNSIISVGKLILIGFREFETPPYKISDLLEIYDSHDIQQLSLFPPLQISSLFSSFLSLQNPNTLPYNNIPNTDDDLILFTNTPTPHPLSINPLSPPQDSLHDEIPFHDI